MRIFLDIGAYDGTTTIQVRDSSYVFDKYVCFEPQASLCDQIRQINDTRIEVCPFGLGKATGQFPMYRGPKLASASLYREKRFRTPARDMGEMPIVAASEWFAQHLRSDDWVIAKMNCEGAECDILEDLFASGEYRKLHGLVVVFDIRKVPGHEARMTTVLDQLGRIPRVFIMEESTANRLGAEYLKTWMPAVA